ncbi:MAG: hypothetical protein KF691_11940 [Phycisphaeraceae bacterium]|nr:hypothetical protein [Phycisphaeraceae bacterium]
MEENAINPQHESIGRESESQMVAGTSVALPESAASRFDWRAFFAHLTTFLSIAIVITLGLGFLLLRDSISQRAETVVAREPARLRIEWPQFKHGGVQGAQQTWLAPQFQEQLTHIALSALGENPDPLSREPLDAVGVALGASGWFDGRPSVVRQGDSEIVVRGEWRVPAAVVRSEPAPSKPGDSSARTDYLISWDGRPMPVIYPEGKSGLFVIKGSAHAPAKNASGEIDFSQTWPGEDCAAGLELLRLLMNQDWRAQVAAVDVSGYSESKQLAIETVYGSRLVWGGRPSKPLTGECATAAKLGKIAELNALSQRIDAGHGELELWWPINKPLEIDRSATIEAQKSASAEPVRH